MSQEELDKLAEKYQDDNTIIRYYGPGTRSELEYDKTMAEVFKDGWNACKRLMMEKAVEAVVQKTYKYGSTMEIVTEVPKEGGFKNGDKVRVIIVKEDEKTCDEPQRLSGRP